MRIIGGKWRSRKLEQPPATVTRPMPDRVKQAVFDMLGVRFGCPGEIPPILVGDFFSGSGSLGLEALSRGARHCRFHEHDRAALQVLRNNVAMLGADLDSTIVPGDAWRYDGLENDHLLFELLFLDPPYRDAADSSPHGPVAQLLSRLSRSSHSGAYLVLHHPVDIEYHALAGGDWNVESRRALGTNGITFFQR